MTLKETIDNEFSEKIIWEDETINEAKKITPLAYERYWKEFPKNEKHYSKKTGNRLYGIWVYKHREKAGAKYGDGKIVHHKDEDKHNNSKSNLEKMSQSEHCKIDPNAKKYEGCKIKDCKNEHYSQGYCQKHYMQRFRAGKFASH